MARAVSLLGDGLRSVLKRLKWVLNGGLNPNLAAFSQIERFPVNLHGGMWSLNGFNLVVDVVMVWRGGWKWSCERCNEYPKGSRLIFACRQNAIDGFVPNNFYWCNGEW